jgi:hypothetical protein
MLLTAASLGLVTTLRAQPTFWSGEKSDLKQENGLVDPLQHLLFI